MILTSKYIVYRPDAFLWVGLCDSFMHAFSTWSHLPDPDSWFIGRAVEYQLIVKGRGKWVKFDNARPWRKGISMPYRGPLTEDDIQLRRMRAINERKRRIRIRTDKLFGAE